MRIAFKILYIIFLLLSFVTLSNAQNLSANRWILGSGRGMVAIFNDTAKPSNKIIYDAPPPYYFDGGHSNICDSATGNLLFSCNGMVLYDSAGQIMDNGDSLVDINIYTYNAFPSSGYTQSSLIIPKGYNGLYYVFTPTISDTAFTFYVTNLGAGGAVPFDQLSYHVVDIFANNGLGKVVEKKRMLLKNVAIHKTMMQACRHSNGIDWWLLKQGEYDTNRIYRFLVRADTIEGPWIQNFPEPRYPSYDLTGQYAFSKDGTKFASIQGKGKMNKLFLADFDRCTGELNNAQVINIPIDSTTNINLDNNGNLDSINNGVCFSPNNQFVYISKRYNIYQYEYQEPDSVQAWYRVQHGPDTTHQAFEPYSHMYRGLDSRIYIGKISGGTRQLSVIDKPDIKGIGCQFCRKCFRLDTAVIFGMTSPPNMPDYNLGAEPGPCWPLANSEFSPPGRIELEVYPNPASTIFYIKATSEERRELYTAIGELVFVTQENEIDVSRYSKGIYYIKVGNVVQKVVIE